MKRSLVLALLAVAACSAKKPAPPPAAAEPKDGRIAIQVSEKGFTPASVHLKANQDLSLVFTRTDENNCASEVVFPSLNIKKDLPLNKPVEVAIHPEKTGEVPFTCGMGMYQGAVVVRD